MILFKFLAGWLILNMVALAALWFFTKVINPIFPNWHKRRVRGFEPAYQREPAPPSMKPQATKHFG